MVGCNRNSAYVEYESIFQLFIVEFIANGTLDVYWQLRADTVIYIVLLLLSPQCYTLHLRIKQCNIKQPSVGVLSDWLLHQSKYLCIKSMPVPFFDVLAH